MRAVVDVTEALVLVTCCHLTARGYVHVSDLTPLEAFDLAPLLTEREIAMLRSPFARRAVEHRLAVDAFQPRRGRRAA